MRINRIYTEAELQSNTDIQLEAGPSLHLLKVLRLKTGAPLELFNGDGNNYQCELLDSPKRIATIRVLSAKANPTESSLRSRLGIVVSKGDRMDFVVQKATELGIHEIYPLTSERCDVKLNAERAEKRQQHWSKVAVSACEQSGRSVIPSIAPIQSIHQWISEVNADLKWVLHHRASAEKSPTEAQSVAILVGPEGGLSETEVELALQHKFIPTVLGPRVLRTETAPLVALSVLQQRYGDFTLL